MSDDTPSKPKCVVTLVHGTGAREADWVHDIESPLRKRVDQELGGDVEFKVFKWTGGNSDIDRFAGAEGLQWALRYFLKEYPDARHFVIGHSHGGNVILRALDGFSEADKVHGAVTLATPFINCAPRALDQFVKNMRRTAIVLLTVLAVLVLTYNADIAGVLKGMTGFAYWETVIVWSVIITWLIAVVYLWLKVFSPNGSALLKAKLRQDKIIAENNHPDDVKVPFLSVATDYDEAAIVLGVGTKLAELILWFDKILKLVVYLLLAVIIGCVIWAGYSFLQKGAWGWPVAFGVLAILLQIFLVFLRTAVSGVGAGFRGLVRSVVFGSGGMIKNSLVAFYTDKKPSGVIKPEYSCCPVNVSIRGMRHSAVYTTPQILDNVAAWISSRCETPDGQQ